MVEEKKKLEIRNWKLVIVVNQFLISNLRPEKKPVKFRVPLPKVPKLGDLRKGYT
jgi:hypothetical protein